MNKILLLEDDLSLVNGLTFAFHKQGFDLTVARTLREGDAAWAEGKYDLLVLTYPCRMALASPSVRRCGSPPRCPSSSLPPLTRRPASSWAWT